MQTCTVRSLPHPTSTVGAAAEARNIRSVERMAIIGFIVFGLVVGYVARALVPGRQRIGMKWTLAIGVVGSLVGGIVANALGTGEWHELNLIGSVVAFASAVVLVVFAERVGLGRDGRG